MRRFSDLQLLPPICVGAWFICYHVAKVRAPGVIVAVSLHLGLCALQVKMRGEDEEGRKEDEEGETGGEVKLGRESIRGRERRGER